MTADVHDLHPQRGGAAPPPPPSCIAIEAEQGVLGAILMNPELLSTLSTTLQPQHFGEDIHRRIFDIALQLHAAGKPISIATLPTYIAGDIAGFTVAQYLARLASRALPGALVPSMAREVRDLAGRRELMAIGDELVESVRAAGPATSCCELASASLADLQRLADLVVAADTRRDPATGATVLIDRARAIMRGEALDDGVSTGLPDLDRATGCFRPGTLWVVAGRPRMGKTILATGFARKVASRSVREAADGAAAVGAQIFSLEVDEHQLTARLLADLTFTPRRALSFGEVLRGAVDEDDIWALEEAQKRLASLPIALDVAAGLSVTEIVARVRAEKARMAKRGTRLAVVFIDYLKFVRPSDRYRGNRVYEVGEITRGLKELAKAEGLCVVLLAQVNRAVDSRDRKDRSPGLSDLRESGDLEADADVVVFIDRESVRVKQSPEYRAGDAEAVQRFIDLEHKADLIVAKTRTGSETTVPIWIDAGASTFSTQARS